MNFFWKHPEKEKGHIIKFKKNTHTKDLRIKSPEKNKKLQGY
jgi:hypothetical protein